MSMSALMSTLRAAGRKHLSAGTLCTKTITGSYLFRIQQYKRLQNMVANDTFIKSGTFSVGGHDWSIHCYPNGEDGNEGSISLYLKHASHDKTGDATADFHMSILDHAGRPLCTDGDAQNFSSDVNLRFGWEDFVRVQDLDEEEYLKDGCLSILCDVTVLDTRTTDYRAGCVVPPSDLHRQLTEVLWESKEGVDVKIEVGGETFPAHRWMLAARSPVFKAELLQSSAALSSRIRVDNMDAGVFKALIHFIYTDALPKEMVERQETLATTMAKPLLLAADRYKLERLKLICEDMLCGHIDVKSVGATLAFADQHSCRMLKEACMEFLADPANLEAAVSNRGFEIV
ncbi:BTB/POZ and MATH domain-containing protein 1-like [Lolium rigidum]|uniref:BTB/POZ and MATH domain-containing protein 1-like n=1 Tax=Lolium rigidum TaxID=89674 RepID=UPI001F5C43F5|nr:BTB/POZ and MATH domain-containing protein 1-like [Lolium rigidum]